MIRRTRSILRTFHIVVFWAICTKNVWAVPVLSPAHQIAAIANISRQNEADTFLAAGRDCNPDTCVGLSSGTAREKDGEPCTCQCLPHLPAFREDLQICVDDIHECPLAPFVSGTKSQLIPFVFLPLKGQIIHPSKEISFAGIQTPICAVSGAQYLTPYGWVDLRNPVDVDVPFRLFRDEGRTFLQWLGESELRARMSGRLIMVHMLCRDIAVEPNVANIQSMFTPCVAFRVVGTPVKYQNNVSEVLFSTDTQSAIHASSGFNSNEYIVIGVCSILLGLIYVASVFLYLHLRKRRQNKDGQRYDNKNKKDDSTETDLQNIQMANEDVIIKSNPLLGLSRHFPNNDNQNYSDSASMTASDIDGNGLPDVLKHNDDTSGSSNQRSYNNQKQLTSAMIHPIKEDRNFSLMPFNRSIESFQLQESPNIERHPEENVSIIETIEGREERPDTVRAIINNNQRRKLYFNPAYFEPHLLQAPPPAAIEFLTKIREVITIAKHKMALKKFTPSLMGIPEEDSTKSSIDPVYDFYTGLGSRCSSVLSLKRENSRRSTASVQNQKSTLCPGCDLNDLDILYKKLPVDSIPKCSSCATSAHENKKRIIRKWLEDVPVLKSPVTSVRSEDPRILSTFISERLKSTFESLPDRPSSRCSEGFSHKSHLHRQASLNTHQSTLDRKLKPKLPERKNASHRKTCNSIKVPPPITPNVPQLKYRKLSYDENLNCNGFTKSLPPPDMINEAIVVDNKTPRLKREKIYNKETESKDKMAAVINEFAVLVKPNGVENGNKNSSGSSSDFSIQNEYETDSLERAQKRKGFHTPTDYGDISSSQPSPSLSTALPMDEEMTMRNAIFNVKTGHKSLSVIPRNEENDYEVIAPESGSKSLVTDPKMYKLPELLIRTNGYNLVSEVYVNNGYNFDSAPTSPSGSDCSSTLERKPKIHYTEPEKPGHLLIEVEDCKNNYIRVDDSDNFEPDTLDRKPSKFSLQKDKNQINQDYLNNNEIIDSLERPGQILLRTTGSFKSDIVNSTSDICNNIANNFNRNFGSLREIYEARTKYNLRTSQEKLNLIETNDSLDRTSWKRCSSDESEEGRILTLEERHARRQRKQTPPNLNALLKQAPPDVIPPLPPKSTSPIYEHPKPPRKVIQEDNKPPLPPKNGNGRSTKRLVTSPTVKEDDSFSPNSTMSVSLPSSISGTSGQTNSSDYDVYYVNPDSGEELEDDLHLCKHKGSSIVENFNLCSENFKRPINNSQFILKTSISHHGQSFKNVTNKNSPSCDTNCGRMIRKTGDRFSDKKGNECIKKTWRKVVALTSPRPEDSGYLSTDSYESRMDDKKDVPMGSVSETDESLGDAQSESGAESVETHSVFFGSYRKRSLFTSSVDSGVGSDWVQSLAPSSLGCPASEEIELSSDNFSFITVLPSSKSSIQNGAM